MEGGAEALKVGLNLLPIAERAGGIGRHAVELPAALLAAEPGLELTVFGSRRLPAMPWEDAVRVVRLPLGAGRASTAVQIGGISAVGLAARLDLLHSIGNVGPPGVPGLPSVTTVHDLIWHHAGPDWGSSAAVAAMRRVALRSARWATRVQVDSEATAADVERIAEVPPERVDVVPLGVRLERGESAEEADVRRELALGEAPVVLTVAQKRPYKNLIAAVRALDAVPEAVLVLPGAHTAHEDELRAEAAGRGLTERVRFVEWVDDRVLEGLYSFAACVVVPSLYEGFGLPVLEAMARGAPVACADAGSLPEVAGDAAVLFDPGDDAAIGAAVARLVRDDDLRRRLSEAGRRQAKRFGWDRCARATFASYERALTASRRGRD